MESLLQRQRFGSIASILLLAISACFMSTQKVEMHFTDNPILKGQDEKITIDKNWPEIVTRPLWSEQPNYYSMTIDQYHYGQVIEGNTEKLNL